MTSNRIGPYSSVSHDLTAGLYAPITAVGYDTNTRATESTARGITGEEMLAVLTSTILEKLIEDTEEAKLRYEDEGDETSLGEYIAYKAAIDRVRKALLDAGVGRYNRDSIQNAMRLQQRKSDASGRSTYWHL